MCLKHLKKLPACTLSRIWVQSTKKNGDGEWDKNTCYHIGIQLEKLRI